MTNESSRTNSMSGAAREDYFEYLLEYLGDDASDSKAAVYW